MQWCRTFVMIRISMFSVLFSRISLGSHHNNYLNINQVTIFVLNRCCILKLLLCSVLFTTFWCLFFLTDLCFLPDRDGECAFFWTTLISLGWRICPLLTMVNFPGVGHLNWKDDRSSNPPPLPSLFLQRLYIDRCII